MMSSLCYIYIYIYIYIHTYLYIPFSSQSPDEVCSEIKACTSKSSKTVQLTAAPEATPTLASSIKCDICEAIAKEVIAVLKKQSTKVGGVGGWG